MSAAKHTPAPWHVDGRDVCAWEGKIETTICECYAHASAGRNVAEHNANLIAAAPDLLAALEAIARLVREGESDGLEFAAIASEALKKARGE